MTEHDTTFSCMGSEVRLLVGPPTASHLPPAEEAAARAQAWLEDFDRRLSRFRPDSELSALNADPRTEVPASALLRAMVAAGRWAAELTDGLVDPTLVDSLESAGYVTSRAGVAPAGLREAFAGAPPRRPAAPDPRERWRSVSVDSDRGTIRRPPGLRLDSGGVGKGLAGDSVAELLRDYSRFLVDCGGDIRVGGPDAAARPYAVAVENPVTGRHAFKFRVGSGAIATSGIDVRIWRNPDGSFAHHLIDPATGTPAWTGLAGVTALGPTALEAETRSKWALLSGPDEARLVLAAHGGRIVDEHGRSELSGPLAIGFRADVAA